MVYLLHFDRPLCHAQHYIGYTESAETLPIRLDHHAHGRGASIMRAVTVAGINWHVVRVWPEADRSFERRLKDQKNSARLCPVCNILLDISLDVPLYSCLAQRKELIYASLQTRRQDDRR